MTDLNEPKKPRALTYTEMMNGGTQRLEPSHDDQQPDLQEGVEALERKVEHLDQVIQRQIQLGRTID